MSAIRRKIISIDEEKCDGCGACVPSCAEGALQIVDGKARLVSEVYCDGLGACLGECPRGAIRIEEREAPEFDEEAVRRHLEQQFVDTTGQTVPTCPSMGFSPERPSGCPGTVTRTGPMLSNWPIQLGLVPPAAPFLRDADLVIAADCTAYSYGGFHSIVKGRVLLIACPKLDDAEAHLEKLSELLRQSAVRHITVVRMEVPCCSALVRIVDEAVRRSGRDIPVAVVVIGVKGNVLDS